MIVYKGFNYSMRCKRYQYRPGQEFVMSSKPILCQRGFHACIMPIDVLNYYPDGIYYKAEVDLENCYTDEDSNIYVIGSKICSNKIKISNEQLSLDDLFAEQGRVLATIADNLKAGEFDDHITLEYRALLDLYFEGIKYSSNPWVDRHRINFPHFPNPYCEELAGRMARITSEAWQYVVTSFIAVEKKNYKNFYEYIEHLVTEKED